MRAWLTVIALFGCNQIYGLDTTSLRPDADTRPDRDEDGIADVEDPCIAAAEDALSDLDFDGITDGIDSCMFSDGTADGDGDGIPDVCDPFSTAGDHHRCNMKFQSRDLNTALWARRPGEKELLAATGYLVALNQASGVAPETILGNAPTIVFDAGWAVAYIDFPSRFGIWLSAQPTPAPGVDVSCEVINSGALGGVRVELIGANRASSAPGPRPRIVDPDTRATAIGMRAYLQPAGTGMNVTCIAGYTDPPGNAVYLTVRGRVDAPLAAFGFFGTAGINSVYGLAVFERSDTPALP